MDARVTNQDALYQYMPPSAPVDMIVQDLSEHPRTARQCKDGYQPATLWRCALFVPAFVGTALLVAGVYRWLADAGLTSLEWALLAMIGATFVWVTLSVSTVAVAIAGLAMRAKLSPAADASDTDPLNVALLVPIYNESTSDVFGNASAMLGHLSRQHSAHRFSLYILSDTRDPEIAAGEERALHALRQSAPAGFSVFYRRRPENTDKKVGNLTDWIVTWGAAHDAMIVLDADSLMTGQALVRLTDALSDDPSAGLIQSFPVLIGAETLFARLQQFSNIAYGWLLAEGLSTWARSEGNYWGHNAIIRVSAFASSAGLPHLRGWRGKSELILSHDFVEAGLLRRAGWRVKFMPRLSGSFEETPASLVDYVRRDRRWCRGNLQHLRLLRTAGMHPVSRYHMLHGAVSYLLSPAWFCLLVIWSLLGKDAETNVIRYFNEANPLFPDWPPEMSHIDSAVFLIIMYAMLLTPKLVGVAIISLHPKATRVYGGRTAFLSAFVVEVLLSVLYAPVLMVQQCKSVVRAVLGVPETWAPQVRTSENYPLSVLLRFHWLETLLGIVLVAGLASGLLSWWLLPIAASLILTVPLSALSVVPVNRCLPDALRMHSPTTLREPGIVSDARTERLRLAALLSTQTVPGE